MGEKLYNFRTEKFYPLKSLKAKIFHRKVAKYVISVDTKYNNYIIV